MEDNEQIETRINRMLRERSREDVERLIKFSVDWSKDSLEVSDGIEDGIINMLGRMQPEGPAEEEESRKGPKEGRGCASLVQREVDGHNELDETREKGKGKGNGGQGEHGSKRRTRKQRRSAGWQAA